MWNPPIDMSKKIDWKKSLRSQPYTKNYKQLSNRRGLFQGKVHQMLSRPNNPENKHTCDYHYMD